MVFSRQYTWFGIALIMLGFWSPAITQDNGSADAGAETQVPQEAVQQTRVTSLLTLTAEEQALVEQHSPLRVGIDSDWFAFEFINEHGEHAGISADYLKLISQRSGLIFDVVGNRPWSEVLDDFANKNLDLLAMAAETPQRAEYAKFARPYVRSPMVIVTRQDIDFFANTRLLGHEPVAVVTDYASHQWLMSDHPYLNLVEVETTLQGLQKVAAGEYFAMVDNLAAVSFLIKQYGLANLKISGQLPYSFDLSIAVRDDWPWLLDIIQRALDTITPDEHAAIYERWVRLEFSERPDYSRIIPLTAGLLVILLLLTIYTYRLQMYRKTLQIANSQLRAAEERLQEKNQELERLSTTDRLTGIFNRYKLEQMLIEHVTLMQRYQHPLSLILMDLDHFKKVNDVHGHAVGDAVLQRFAVIVQNTVRKVDIFGRWGGEEFLLICPETDLQAAVGLAEKIRKIMQASGFPDGLQQTLSAGVVQYQPDESTEQALARCDTYLYQAKERGRNQVAWG